MNDEGRTELNEILNTIIGRHNSECLDTKDAESLFEKEKNNGIRIRITQLDYISIYTDITYVGYELEDCFLDYAAKTLRQNNKVLIWIIVLSYDIKRYQLIKSYIAHGDILHIALLSITELDNQEYLENVIGIIKLVQLKYVVVFETGNKINEIVNILRFITKVTGTKVYYANPLYRGYDYEDVDQIEDQE